RPCSSDTARPGPTARKSSPTSLFSTAPPETSTSWRCPRKRVGGRGPQKTAPAHVCQHLPAGRVTVALLVLLSGAARAGRVACCARVLVGLLPVLLGGAALRRSGVRGPSLMNGLRSAST